MGRKATTQTNPTTAIERSTDEIERVVQQCNTLTLKDLPALRQAVVLAQGVTQLRRTLSDAVVSEVFMPLQGSPLGFQTDRDNPEHGKPVGYPLAVVRECMIEALVAGFRPVGNEVNIIAGRCYGTKNGYQRKVSEFPGLTDLRLTPGVPQSAGERGALVPMRASWKLNGQPMELIRDVVKGEDGIQRDTRIAVRVNRGMGADAVIGKATRKALKAIHDLVSGSTFTLEDGDLDALDTQGETVAAAPPPAASAPDGRRMKLGGNGTSGPMSVEAQQSLPGGVSTREPGDDSDEDEPLTDAP